jgi:tRNA modification GTPase
VRDSEDEIERAGMERTRRQVERADLVLHVVDASEGISDFEFQISDLKSPTLLVLNKIDLGEHGSWNGVEGVRISCLKNHGLKTLAAAIEARVFGGTAAHRDWSLAINARHEAALERAQGFAEAARRALIERLSPEFVAEELRGVLGAISDILGRVDQDEVLGKIFSSFCIGK